MEVPDLDRNHSYSQFGEDREILQWFGRGYAGFFVEVGANNGERDSNSLLLEQFGWRGILIEANPSLAAAATKARPKALVLNIAACERDEESVKFYRVSQGGNLDGLSSMYLDSDVRNRIVEAGGTIDLIEVPGKRLDGVLKDSLPVGQTVDFVSIDVEGAEWHVIRGFDFKCFKPRLLLIEDNTRGKERRIPRLLKENNYVRVHRTGWNDWYVPLECASGFLFRRICLRLRLFKWAIQRLVG